MRWTGNPDEDNILTLLDVERTVILGQVIKDGNYAGWHGHDYSGEGRHVGLFASATEAMKATEASVAGRPAAIDSEHETTNLKA